MLLSVSVYVRNAEMSSQKCAEARSSREKSDGSKKNGSAVKALQHQHC
jgi:hypothetical protein